MKEIKFRDLFNSDIFFYEDDLYMKFEDTKAFQFCSGSVFYFDKDDKTFKPKRDVIMAFKFLLSKKGI